MEMQRISFDMPSEDHKYLKICCAKLGVSLKEFITRAINEKVEAYEDEWLFKDSCSGNRGRNVVCVEYDQTVNDI